MRESEYHMEVGRINTFCPAFVYPYLLINSLTAGAVTVAAEILVELGMSAIGADAGTATQCADFAPQDRHDSLILDIGWTINGKVFLPSKLENLFSFTLCHKYLPSYQEGL